MGRSIQEHVLYSSDPIQQDCIISGTSNGIDIDKDTIVEVWKDWKGNRSNQTLANVTKAGYRAILATPWYLNYNSYSHWESLTRLDQTKLENSNGVPIDNDTIVEVWKDYKTIHYNDTLASVTKAGYRAILAAPWYLNRVAYGIVAY